MPNALSTAIPLQFIHPVKTVGLLHLPSCIFLLVSFYHSMIEMLLSYTVSEDMVL